MQKFGMDTLIKIKNCGSTLDNKLGRVVGISGQSQNFIVYIIYMDCPVKDEATGELHSAITIPNVCLEKI